MQNLELVGKKYWQESWFATIVFVVLTWSVSFFLGSLGFRAILIFITCGLLYLFITRDTNKRELIAWRLLIKRWLMVSGIMMVIVVIFSLLPLLISGQN